MIGGIEPLLRNSDVRWKVGNESSDFIATVRRQTPLPTRTVRRETVELVNVVDLEHT